MDQNLLRITRVPIEFEYRSTPARLEIQQSRASLEITRERNGLSIRSNPIRVRINSEAARASAGLKNMTRLVRDHASAARSIAMSGIQRIVEEGNQMADIHVSGKVIANVAASNMTVMAETALTFMPSERPEISYAGGDIEIRFVPDKLHFSWNINKVNTQFVPPEFEIMITQWPELIIEYIGEPFYVPPRSDAPVLPPDSEVSVLV